ncbi:MAG: riboflavin kinase [Atribacterota bacterium]
MYMFDFDDNIYGKKMYILLLKRIRDEKKFNNIGDLTRQIEKDKIIANDYFQEKYS